ncbi:MAG: T9SS type A sorting domain-containing protein, partial [Bacteroidota bacterium]
GLNTQGILVGIDGTSGNFIIEVTAVSCGVNVGTFKEVTVSRGGGGFFRKGGEQSDEPLKDILTDGELTVFPNPAVEVINLTSGSPMKILSAEMIDLQGRRVLSQKIEDTNATLELKSVRNGIYLLNLLMEDGSIEMRKISVGQ